MVDYTRIYVLVSDWQQSWIIIYYRVCYTYRYYDIVLAWNLSDIEKEKELFVMIWGELLIDSVQKDTYLLFINMYINEVKLDIVR